jgi:hypothetical protein
VNPIQLITLDITDTEYINIMPRGGKRDGAGRKAITLAPETQTALVPTSAALIPSSDTSLTSAISPLSTIPVANQSKPRRTPPGGRRIGAGRKPDAVRGRAAQLMRLVMTEAEEVAHWKALLSSPDMKIRAAALKELSDRHYGKATQAVELDAEVKETITFIIDL